MVNLSIVLAAIQIIAIVSAIVLFVLGLYASIKDIRYINKEDPADEEAHSKESFKKGMIYIACGIGAYFVAQLCAVYPQMSKENYGFVMIALQALWEAIRSTGFLILFPFIIRQWRKTARRNADFR